jgi:hypothetical protein
MIQRCYNINNHDYKYYGEKGITVEDSWRYFDNFVKDFDKIKGYNLELLLKHKLCLDKDCLNFSKQYSLNNCMLISKEENNKFKPNQQNKITAISPDGVLYKFYNQSEFAKQHNLKQNCISKCIYNQSLHHKGWRFSK